MQIKATNVFQRNWDAKTKFIVNIGGSRCFSPNTLVITKNGNKKIKNINNNDEVLSFNEATNKKEYKKVKNVFKMENSKKTIKLTLKNGETIIATEDHKFWFKGGWHSLKNMILYKEKNKF